MFILINVMRIEVQLLQGKDLFKQSSLYSVDCQKSLGIFDRPKKSVQIVKFRLSKSSC